MKKVSISILTVFIIQLFIMPLGIFAETLIANDFTKNTPRDTTLSFSSNDFLVNSNPPSGKKLISVTFNQVTNPSSGNLKLNGSVVNKGNTVSLNDLNSLVFVPVVGYEGEAIFTWTANYDGAKSPYPGAVVITIGSGVETPSIIPDKNEENTEEKNDPDDKPQINESKENEEVNEESSAKENKNELYSEEKINNAHTNTNELKPLRYEDMLTHWGAYSAGMLASRGYVIGEDYGNNFYFHPDEKINRLDFVLMVNSVFGVKPKDSLADNPFSDKNVPSYVMRVGISAYEYGIISGTKGKDGKLYFRPYDTITRAEAITIIDYALSLETFGVRTSGFRDIESVPDWAVNSVNNLDAYGIVQGFGDNTVRPNLSITRAEAAEMVWQTLKFLDMKRNSGMVYKAIIYGD